VVQLVKGRENEILGGKSDIFRIRIKNRKSNSTQHNTQHTQHNHSLKSLLKLKATATMISIAVPPEYGWVVLGAG
jgi:hypothetical protein